MGNTNRNSFQPLKSKPWREENGEAMGQRTKRMPWGQAGSGSPLSLLSVDEPLHLSEPVCKGMACLDLNSAIFRVCWEGREDREDQAQGKRTAAEDGGGGDFLVNTHYLILGRICKFAILILRHRVLCLNQCYDMCMLRAGSCPLLGAYVEAPTPSTSEWHCSWRQGPQRVPNPMWLVPSEEEKCGHTRTHQGCACTGGRPCEATARRCVPREEASENTKSPNTWTLDF